MNAKPLQAIEEQIRALVASQGNAPVSLLGLQSAFKADHGPSPDGDARAEINGFAERLRMNYHIDGAKGTVVFRPAPAP